MRNDFSRTKFVKAAVVLLAASLVFAFGMDGALANGGTRPLVTDARSGPYELRVGIFPGRPKVGNLHLSIFVKDAEAGSSITNATVTVTLTGPEGATNVGPVQATTTPQNPGLNEVDVPLDIEGSWTLNLKTNSHLGRADLDLPLEVAEPQGLDVIYPLVGSVAVLALAFWAWDRFGGRRKRRGK